MFNPTIHFRVHLNAVWTSRAAALGCLLACLSASAATWQPQGPAPIIGAGNVEGMTNPTNPQNGAVQAILVHPTDPNTVYIGTANGGVWKTSNGGTAWTPLTDTQSSLSVGGLAFDTLDTSYQTVIVGIGRWSNSAEEGGPRSGVLYSTDGGTHWVALGGGTLTNYNLGAVAARGSVILAAANKSNAGPGAFFRSGDKGQTFTPGPTGLPPTGTFTALVGDPSAPNVFYTADVVTGFYRSADTGATWTNITGTITNFSGSPVNANIGVGANGGVVFVSIVNQNSTNVDLYYSKDQGTNWNAMDPPGSTEGNVFTGPNPSAQGNNSSLAADPVNPNLVYIAGDTQPAAGVSSGAAAYSARMFRGDASATPGTQWTYLTGNFTTNGSAPHADSRVMAFDAAGNLLEGDDGGIYKRTAPQSTNGAWFSIMGNLPATEIHSIAYDHLTKTLLSGNQDNGATTQNAPGGSVWSEAASGDGGKVAINNNTSTNFSVRYYSSQNLGGFTHQKVDPSNNPIDTKTPDLQVAGTNLATYARGKGEEWTGNSVGDAISFFPIVTLNRIEQTRIAIATKRVYLGTDDVSGALSDTIALTDISTDNFDSETSAVAWGHQDNTNLLLVAAADALYLSVTATPGSLTRLTNYSGRAITDVLIHPGSSQTFFVADGTTVWSSTDAGNSWTNIGAALESLGFQQPRTFQFISAHGTNALLVGGLGGFYASRVDATPTVWFRFADGMPNVVVWDSKYDAADDLLAAGTLGRGAWTLPSASTAVLGPSGGPLITTQPAGKTATVGDTVTFSISVTSDTLVAYQWRKDGKPVTGGTSASLTLTNITTADSGVYSVVVSNAVATVTSANAALTVNAAAGGTPSNFQIALKPGNRVEITWEGAGRLQQAASVAGPWSDAGSTDGKFAATINASNTFFRVVNP